MTSREFLRAIWTAQPHKTGYVFISVKRGDEWKDHPLKMVDGKVKIPPLPQDADVYFCPTIFSEPRRKREFALSTVWLHADLDEVHPDSVSLNPTTAWTTSSERYQCLWRLTRSLKVTQFEALNQRLTYLTKADKGGWSITKVLRVPGTLNHKRDVTETVTPLWHDLQHYLPKVVLAKVREVKVVRSVPVEELSLPEVTADALYHRYRKRLSQRTRQLLRRKRTVGADRSERLWELECLLLQDGVKPEEVLILVRESVWNKYAGQRRELPMLWGEINKANAHIKAKETESTLATPSKSKVKERSLKFESYEAFLAKSFPSESWTVEGIWANDAHGLIAGEAKTYKSIIATDLAVSVASGTKFLGTYDVPATGPVLMIQEENTPLMMADRLKKIAVSKGIAGKAEMNGNGKVDMKLPNKLPIKLMNNKGFNLLDEDDTKWLEEQVIQVKPKLVILDPLYLMIPGVNESSQLEITPILRKLLMLKQKYDVGILIVHHYNKPREEEGRHSGHRIAGSSVFYRWFESALYLEKGNEPGSVKMTTEHRSQAPGPSTHLEIDMGQLGEPYYHVAVSAQKDAGSSLRHGIRVRVMENPGVTVAALAEEFEIRGERVKRLVEGLGFRIRIPQRGGGKGRPSPRIYPSS